MFNSSRLDITQSGRTSHHLLFHRNMSALMAFNNTPAALKTCYREGMFAHPNHEGFVQVSHYLLNIIYPETKAFRNCWPILDRSQERGFRHAVCESMRGLNDYFSDILQFPDVVASKLMSPGGDRFVKFMWMLSLLALAVMAKRKSGCHLLRQPTENAAASVRGCSARMRRCATMKNLEDSEQAVINLVSKEEEFSQMKEKSLDRMMERKESIRVQEAEVRRLIKEAGMEDYLLKKLMDLNSIEGLSILEEMVTKKKGVLTGALGNWEEYAKVARNCNVIIKAAVKEGQNEQKVVLDASHVTGRLQMSDSFMNSESISAPGKVGESVCVSLVKYLRLLRDKLRFLKLDYCTSDLSMWLAKWEVICGDEVLLVSEMKHLEAELEKKVFELSLHGSNGIENNMFTTDVPKGKIEKPLQSTPISTLGSVAYASTPVKSALRSLEIVGTSIGSSGTMNITPYQPPSRSNYFSDNLEVIQKQISGDREESKQALPVIVINKPERRSSLGEIMERFRKVQESMKKQMKH